jgi:hypothetical protein
MSAFPAVLATNDPSLGIFVVWIIINSLAVARLARIVARDDITASVRQNLHRRYEGALVDLLTCTWCLAVWFSAVAVVLTVAATTRGWWMIIASGLAIAELAGITNEVA